MLVGSFLLPVSRALFQAWCISSRILGRSKSRGPGGPSACVPCTLGSLGTLGCRWVSWGEHAGKRVRARRGGWETVEWTRRLTQVFGRTKREEEGTSGRWGKNAKAAPTPKLVVKEMPENCWPGKQCPEGLGWAGEQTVTVGCHLYVRRLPGPGLLNSGRTRAALPSWHPDSPQGCSPAPRGSMGWLGSVPMSPAERPGSWQTGTAPSLLRCELGGGLPIHLSVCQEGS